MGKLDDLYEFAEECDIDIVCRKFSHTKKAACMHLKPHKIIILDMSAIENESEEVSILAEEIGHYETGSLYVIESTHNTPIAQSNRMKYEANAVHWGYKKYLTPEEIEQAVKQEGAAGDYAIAEYCGVTVDFLRRAIEYYRSHGVVFDFDGGDGD